MAELIVLTGPAAERRLEIGSEERLVIGRDEGCNLVLDDSKVSRRHAYLQEIDGGVEVGDLGERRAGGGGLHRDHTSVRRLCLAAR